MLSLHRSHIILFLISPFLMLLANINKYRSKYFPGVLYLFFLFYGFTFTVASDAFDAARIMQKFSEASKASFADYSGISEILITGNTQIVESIIIWFVANTFESSQVLFMIYAAIFGFFYVKNYELLLSFYKGENKYFELVLLVTFMMLIPIWEINGWRMWTASHIFVYSVLSFLQYGLKTRYVFLVLLTPFVHFSFWLMVAPFLLFTIANVLLSRKILFPIFVLTLFTNPFNVEKSSIESAVNLEFAQTKIKGYGNEDYIESSKEKEDQLSIHAKYYKIALHYGLILPFCFLVYKRKWPATQNDKILKWTLFFGIVANVIALLPFADMLRFRMIHYFFVLYCLVYMYKFSSGFRFNRLFSYTIGLLLVFFNLVELRKGLDRFGIATIITNPITVHFFPQEENTAIINYIK